MDAPALVTVRFKTARAMLTGCHLSGLPYHVPVDFARQVVEVEQVADYVTPPVSKVEDGIVSHSKRKR